MAKTKLKTIIKKPSRQPEKKKYVRNRLITIVLLYDQYTRRMKAYGPSPLIPINKSKLLDYHIKYITDIFPKNEIVICTGFDADKVQKYIQEKYSKLNIRVVENQIFENTNSCESLRLCLNNIINSNILILNGNFFFYKESIQKINTSKSCILYEDHNHMLDVGINFNNDTLEHMDIGLKAKWSEIFFINDKTMLDLLKRILTEPMFKKKFIFEAINRLLQNNHKILCVKNEKCTIKLDNMKQMPTRK